MPAFYLDGYVDVLYRTRGPAYRDRLRSEYEPWQPVPVEHAGKSYQRVSERRHAPRGRAARGPAGGLPGRRGA